MTAPHESAQLWQDKQSLPYTKRAKRHLLAKAELTSENLPPMGKREVKSSVNVGSPKSLRSPNYITIVISCGYVTKLVRDRGLANWCDAIA